MIEVLSSESTPERVVLSSSLYVVLFLYFAWVCRRKSLARLRWGIILCAVAIALVTIALHFMLFLPPPIENAFWWGKWLSVLASGFLAGGVAFFVWAVFSMKLADPAPIKLMAPAERWRFWIEVGVGVALSIALFLL